MSLHHLEDAKKLRAYCAQLGRRGVAERIIEIAKNIVEGKGAYITTLKNAGRIRALCIGAKWDHYWDEKQFLGYIDMINEAEFHPRADLFKKEDA